MQPEFRQMTIEFNDDSMVHILTRPDGDYAYCGLTPKHPALDRTKTVQRICEDCAQYFIAERFFEEAD